MDNDIGYQRVSLLVYLLTHGLRPRVWGACLEIVYLC